MPDASNPPKKPIVLVGLMGAGLVIWLPAAIAKLRHLAEGPFLGALCALVIVAPPLVLAPLYATQNYYPAAMSPVVAMVIGLGAAWGWEHRQSRAGQFVVIAGPALWIATLAVTLDYWTIGYGGVVDRDGSLPHLRPTSRIRRVRQACSSSLGAAVRDTGGSFTPDAGLIPFTRLTPASVRTPSARSS